MNRRHVTAALLALLVLGAGAAAATPGAAPDDVPATNQNGEAGPSVDVGPPGDLPSQVPDFVGDVHDRIGGFLNGSIDSLGEAVSGVTPGGDEQSDGAGDSGGDARSSGSGDDA
jgi:hypothetical protein